MGAGQSPPEILSKSHGESIQYLYPKSIPEQTSCVANCIASCVPICVAAATIKCDERNEQRGNSATLCKLPWKLYNRRE